ncbi:VOC family protein [Pengzhenrongella frigida]|uniref:Glyoxalase n=1 Tax=Pengzhenrongella frigida TaxID=1259133 RepID=A0A4Q5N0B7_9MICO|nr:VOC family protein [Cellulomonas sp. HLT2-17]RYV51582.1 glyoxalase [Cellulomonas sp. HLT2-17]
MTPILKTVIHPVSDLAQAKALYATLLGSEPILDEAYYVQFNTATQEVGLDPHGHSKGMTGPVNYWHVADLADTVARLLTAGATAQQPVTDVGGRLIASVTDADGNVIGLLQAAQQEG